MLRRLLSVLGPVTLLVGCMKPSMPMEPPQKPSPAPEMKKLEPMVGTWTETGEIVEPNPEEMKKMMPESERAKFKSTFAGGGKAEWAMGGIALKWEGWHDMGEGQKESFVEYWTWDPKVGKFHTLYVSDWGKTGAGVATPCESCNGWCVKGTGFDDLGQKSSYEGCLKMTDKDSMEWCFTERGPMGKMSLKGTSKRQK